MFAKFRDAATSGEPTTELTAALRRQLITVMSRNERSDLWQHHTTDRNRRQQ